MSMKEKLRAVQAAVSAIEKQFGKGAIMALGEQREIEPVATIGTGAPSLDAALGCGGYPRGRVVEVFGPEASGKTTLTLHAIAECQRNGGVAAFVDAEHALDLRYAASLGVKPETLLVSQPDSGEQALEIVETLVRSGAVEPMPEPEAETCPACGLRTDDRSLAECAACGREGPDPDEQRDARLDREVDERERGEEPPEDLEPREEDWS